MTDEFTTAARAAGADPDEVRESMRNALAHAEQNGLTVAQLLAWVWHAGAAWARDHLDGQEATDAEVRAAAIECVKFLFLTAPERPWEDPEVVEQWELMARAALNAARDTRRDEGDT